MSDEVYNPLDKLHLAESIERALMAQAIHRLPPGTPFTGAGIYAIYYEGDFEPYRLTSSPNCERPIYVGSALPEGGRTGGVGLATPTTRKLYDRLRQHTRSIEQAINLELVDFRCRYLLVDDVWIPLGEQYLIGLYRPLWNSDVVSGFGIHDPGRGRSGQRRSLWDELHPGRSHADQRPPASMTANDIAIRVESYLRGGEPVALSSESEADLTGEDLAE